MDETNRILVVIGKLQFVALQKVTVNYRNGKQVEYDPKKVRKLYINENEFLSIQEVSRELRED